MGEEIKITDFPEITSCGDNTFQAVMTKRQVLDLWADTQPGMECPYQDFDDDAMFLLSDRGYGLLPDILISLVNHDWLPHILDN